MSQLGPVENHTCDWGRSSRSPESPMPMGRLKQPAGFTGQADRGIAEQHSDALLRLNERCVDPLRILYVTPYIPSPIRVRPYNLIKYLSDRGHLLTVVSARTSGEEISEAEGLRPCCYRLEISSITRRESLWNCLQALPTSMPLQAVYCWTPRMRRRIETELQGDGGNTPRYDVCHIEHLRGANYGLGLDTHVPIVWDSVDCISHLFEQASRDSRTLFGRRCWYSEQDPGGNGHGDPRRGYYPSLFSLDG